jgi:hypothetical protein
MGKRLSLKLKIRESESLFKYQLESHKAPARAWEMSGHVQSDCLLPLLSRCIYIVTTTFLFIQISSSYLTRIIVWV